MKMKNTDVEKYRPFVTQVTSLLNNFSFNPEMFCQVLATYEHRTLQQSFTRLCLAWLKHCATDEYASHADGRNQASHELAKKLVDVANDHDIHMDVPFI